MVLGSAIRKLIAFSKGILRIVGKVNLSHCFLKVEHASVTGRDGGPREAHVAGHLPQFLESINLGLVPRICISEFPGNINASGPERTLWKQVEY